MSVKDYNKEASLNVSISGINIAEGCAPSGINDAIRQLMADVKEESEAQAEAVAGAESSASEQLTALDSTLRELIAQEVAKYLPLSGGVMTGAIQFGGAVRNVAAVDTTGEVTLCGGTAWDTGAFIAVHGKDHVGLEGVVDISAHRPGYNSCHLFLRPGELPLANGSPVLTAAGGVMAGELEMGSTIRSTTQSGSPVLVGSGIELWMTAAGDFLLRPGGDYAKQFAVLADGTVQSKGSPLLTLVASWRSGADWYRKYSDGFIVQSVLRTAGTGTQTISLHTAMATTNYLVKPCYYGATGGEIAISELSIHNRTTTTFQHAKNYDNRGAIQYLVMGY